MARIKKNCHIFGWAVILLMGLFLSQDMCLWPAPDILYLPSITVLFAGTLFIFGFLAAVPASLFFVMRSVWRWRDRPAAASDFLRAVVCLLFVVGYIGISIWCSTRRTAAFARASVNAAPIIGALTDYHAGFINMLSGQV